MIRSIRLAYFLCLFAPIGVHAQESAPMNYRELSSNQGNHRQFILENDLPHRDKIELSGRKVSAFQGHTLDGECSDSSHKPRIVMLGNSITYQGNWAELLEREDILNGAQPGWTSQQLSWVIKDYIIPHEPVLCFFMAGINDYTLGIKTKRIYQNICENLDSISHVGTNPVFQTTLYQYGNRKVNREIDKLNRKLIRFCKKMNYDFVDLRPILCEAGDIKKEFVQDDNTHLQAHSYQKWAEAIRPVLRKYELE